MFGEISFRRNLANLLRKLESVCNCIILRVVVVIMFTSLTAGETICKIIFAVSYLSTQKSNLRII